MKRLFYCSFRNTVSSTLVCRNGSPSQGWLGVCRRPGAGRITPAGRGEHRFGDGGERENLHGGVKFDCLARDAVGYASGLILRDGTGACLSHLQESLVAICTHSCEQASHCVGSCG